MYCSHCGSPLKPGAQYCESCGQQIAITAPKQSEPTKTEESTPRTHQKKAMPSWFKIIIALAVLALIAVTFGILFTERLVEVVDDQLAALKSNDITKAYYAYTSKDFQAATSLEQFKDFVNTHPFFIQNHSTHFSERAIKNKIGTIKGTITSQQNQKFPVEYQLTKEDGKWKILNITLLSITEEDKAKLESEKEEVLKIVNEQLNALHKGDFETAYNNFTSPEFKQATSLEKFKAFVENVPLLVKRNSPEFTVIGIEKDAAKINLSPKSGHLNDSNEIIEYTLVKQEGIWKVWSIRTLKR